jgi:hypothetical protein
MKKQAKKKTRSGPSGTNITEERRAELGTERLMARPPAGTRAQLAMLASVLGVSSSLAVAEAVRRTLAAELARAKAG